MGGSLLALDKRYHVDTANARRMEKLVKRENCDVRGGEGRIGHGVGWIFAQTLL